MANDKPDPQLPEPLWNALSKLSHIVSREDTEPPLLHHRQRSPISTFNPAFLTPTRTHTPPSSSRTTQSKPAFLLLHGAWHTPTCWSRLAPLLQAHGHPVCAPHLPSSGANPPLHNWDPDIAVIRDSVTRLARDEGRDVVVVMHAHAGLAGSEGLSGLEKQACGERGWRGGVVRLVYVCAFMFGEGWTQVPPGTGEGLDRNITVDLARGIYYVHPAQVKAMMYQDVSDAEIAAIAAQLVPQSLAGNWCTSSFAAWRWIPSTYVIALGDQKATVAAEEWIVKSAVESGRCAVDRVVRRKVGHCPHWSQAEWMARLLAEEAERSVR
ncbi:alpha/beta-hydrolase [Paraphaeosphaeria sporulosa]|uniref:Alpha/beta-hydrolase n=1 Tax=Paraphaeosphaeria sporulosa TaxID=1460663 RepID=A0A177C7J8_9PLEO|nr:alpha/beta-hydrolase [Paraphaeosphaeria sporulosa]OAG03623.1 alpha/beta-hydrolase [Paraphaeosphaeria sporulosa]